MKQPPEFVVSLRDNSEHIPCPLCCCTDYTPVYEGIALRENQLICVICKRCTHLYLNPRPPIQAYKEFYTGDNYFHLCADYSEVPIETKLQQFERNDFWKERFGYGERLYDSYLKGRLRRDDVAFDFGCGDGAWLWALQELTACQVDGQEISDIYADVVSKRLGIKIFLGPIEELGERIIEKHKGKIKLVIVSGSLQHMLDPMECLRVARAILADDGYLYVCNWNLFDHYMTAYQEKQRRLFAEVLSWEHLHYFHSVSFRFMLEKAGFEILDLNPESAVRPRHMDAFARKAVPSANATVPQEFSDVVARLHALELATVAGRFRALANSLGQAKHRA